MIISIGTDKAISKIEISIHDKKTISQQSRNSRELLHLMKVSAYHEQTDE
jgi:hypothetical protein